MLTIHERLEEFLTRMRAAPCCGSFDAAFALLSETLNAVEDELSGIPFDPERSRFDGRMYPPQEDARRTVLGREDLRRYRSKQHSTYFSMEGAILIVGPRGEIVLDKPDLNARSIKL